jgi:hypothetical protein
MVITARFCVATVLFLVIACRDDPESSGAKSENSVIQAMNARYEQAAIQQLTFKTEMDHHFAFVPWRGQHICIMLDPKYTPYYKQGPWGTNFCLTQGDFDAIDKSRLATDTVIAVLAAHICDNSAGQ